MSKINSAESIRGLACLAVVFSHLALTFFPYLHNFTTSLIEPNTITYWLHHSPFAFFYSGTAAVFIFFVLSGFVLSYAILRKSDVDEKIISMALKRYPRLAIPALISCVIAWSLFNLNIDSSSLSEWFQRYGQVDQPFYMSIYDGLINSFFLGDSVYNWVLWTMQIELFGSFVLFFMLYCLNRNKTIFHASALLPPLPFVLFSPVVTLGIYSFVIGIYIYLYGKKISIFLAIPLLILGLYLAGAHSTSESYKLFSSILGNRTDVVLCFFSGILIVYSILMCDWISKILDKPSLVYLGKLSFSMYLLHMIAIYTIGVPTFNMLTEINFTYNSAALIACIVTLITTFVSSIFYSHYIDNLSIKVANTIERKYTEKKEITV